MTRWQYGVTFADGSTGWHWSGRTSRLHAEEVIAQYPNETHLVRRPVDIRGHVIGEPEPMPEDPRPWLCRIGDHAWSYADEEHTVQVCPKCGATRELEDWWI